MNKNVKSLIVFATVCGLLCSCSNGINETQTTSNNDVLTAVTAAVQTALPTNSNAPSQIMNRLNKLWLQAKILLGNTIILTSDPTNPQNLTGAFKEELEWLAEAGLKHFVKIGEGLWQAVK